MAVPTPHLWGPCAEMLSLTLWSGATGSTAEPVLWESPIPQLTGITYSSPRGVLRGKHVLWSTFIGTSHTWTEELPRWLNGREPAWSLGQAYPLELKITTHSSILAWEIPLTEEPGLLQSMGLQRIRHYWVTHTHTRTAIRWNPLAFGVWLGRVSNKTGRNQTVFHFPGGSDSEEAACNGGDQDLTPGLGRSPREGNRQPTPVFLRGEFHGILVGYCPWSCKESDKTEWQTFSSMKAAAI